MTAAAAPSRSEANLVELFSAIQGEGAIVGTRQIFVRFARCDLRCHYCDSAHTWDIDRFCRLEKTPGVRDFEFLPNPIAADVLLDAIARQNRPHLHDSISLTGGEPLLHAQFLQAFLPQLRDRVPLPVYLESGGHRPHDLQLVLPYLDLIGMDIKLPSVSGESRWEAHRLFLERCHTAGVDVFVKAIVAARTNTADLEQMAALVARIDPKIPIYLQPATPLAAPHAETVLPPLPEQVLTWQAQLKQSLASVRVVPQTHKAIGQL